MNVSGQRAGPAQRLPLGGEWADCPAISPDGRHLAYSQVRGQDDIMRLELSDPARSAGNPARFASSTRSEMWPEYSPDGGSIAFLSDRSGQFEVWKVDSDGLNPRRISTYTGTFGAKLTWSPGGERIAFSSIRERTWDIVLASAQGGIPRHLEIGLKADGLHSQMTIAWSNDGQWIHYSLTPAVESGTWKIRATGGTPVRIEEDLIGAPIGTYPEDGLYYLKPKAGEPRHQELWKLHLRDGRQSMILGSVFRASYAVAEDGVYFSSGRDLDCRCYHLQFLDFESGEIKTIVDIQDIGEGISVSPDGQSLLYTERSQTNSDIMLVENFH